MASSALANMYLDRLSHVLEVYSKENIDKFLSRVFSGSLAVRWMDDLWVFGDDSGVLRLLQVDFQAVVRDAGLELNLGKTDVLSDDDLWLAAREVEHSAVDAAIGMNPRDVEPLERMLDQLIENPERSDRTSIRFAMTRMRRQGVKSRLERLVEVAPRMPHGADHLARALRDFGLWRSHDD